MKGIENLSCMNFDLTEEQNMFLDQVSRACREIREFEDKAYLERRYNEKIYPILRKAHLLGIPISQIYGGAGADILTYVLATQRLGQEGFSVRTFFSAHISIGQLVIQEFGNEEQKERYLKKTTSGEMIMAFALTEPTSGSDPASLRCKYEDRGDHYVLNGSKCWISNATKARLITTYARDKETKKISAFIVEAESEGYSVEEEKNKMGVVTSDTGSIYFDDCPVPKENLLFEEGKGLNVAFGALMNGRLSVAAGCVGVMEDCLKEAQEYAKQRVQHGKEIAKHQLIQRHIAIISTNLEAAKFLTYRAALAKM
ncbi:MAG: acyl-CoA dehydrogenase family protein, partial [Candidatus Methanofastidiosia archaeon]